jgi:hypothetical protein
MMSHFAYGPHRIECLGDDFGGVGATSVVRGLCFEKLGASEDHPQLVAEAVKERAQFRRTGLSRPQDLEATRRQVHAWDPVVRGAALTWRAGEPGSRHSESA